MNNVRIFIATPMYGGMCTGAYAASLFMLAPELNRLGIELTFGIIPDSLITRGRNMLVHSFLKRTNATHLLFIDGDIQFTTKDVLSMLECDLDIIAATYPLKMIDWEKVRWAALQGEEAEFLSKHGSIPCTRLLDDMDELPASRQDPVEVAYCGTGFMLIKRNVFEKLSNKVKVYLNDTVFYSIEIQEPIQEFFFTSITDKGKLLSEDYNFCQLARDNNIKVHLASWVNLKHIGAYAYS